MFQIIKSAVFLLMAAVFGLFSCIGSDDSSRQDKVQSVVSDVRLKLASDLGNPVPSLNLIIQTPRDTIFVSSSDTARDAVTADTCFRFASNTKNFTAAAVLKMHQDGWLDISHCIVGAIPGSTTAYVPDTADWAIPNKAEVTIEQLLQHSAGVFDVDNDVVPGYDGKTYTEYITDKDPDHQFTAAELVGVAAANTLSYFLPGQGYHYSNTGYSILSEIIARVYSFQAGTPKTYTDFLEAHITGSTAPVRSSIGFPYLAGDRTMPAPHACGRVVADGNTTVYCDVNMSAQLAEGNGYGTLSEMNTHIRTLMRGENVLSSQIAALMRERVSAANGSYGLGCDFHENLGYGHNGARVGNLSFMAYNPDTQVSLAVYLPLWDLSRGMDSFMLCYTAMYDAGYAALEALGFPGKP